jgi:hypothetical protein
MASKIPKRLLRDRADVDAASNDRNASPAVGVGNLVRPGDVVHVGGDADQIGMVGEVETPYVFVGDHRLVFGRSQGGEGEECQRRSEAGLEDRIHRPHGHARLDQLDQHPLPSTAILNRCPGQRPLTRHLLAGRRLDCAFSVAAGTAQDLAKPSIRCDNEGIDRPRRSPRRRRPGMAFAEPARRDRGEFEDRSEQASRPVSEDRRSQRWYRPPATQPQTIAMESKGPSRGPRGLGCCRADAAGC